MVPVTFRAVLDANVLFPFTLRDTLLRAAAAGYYQVYWSDKILDETTRNLKAKMLMTDEQAEHLVTEMTKAFPEALIRGFEPLIEAMTNDEKDRHVVAAAVKSGAEVIVTNNLKDFRNLPEGVEAQSPDEFLVDLLELNVNGMVALLQAQSDALKRPPKSFNELLVGLEKIVPGFVRRIREDLSAGHE